MGSPVCSPQSVPLPPPSLEQPGFFWDLGLLGGSRPRGRTKQQRGWHCWSVCMLLRHAEACCDLVLLESLSSRVHGTFFKFLCVVLEILVVSPYLFLYLSPLQLLEVLPHVARWLPEVIQLHCDKSFDAPWSTWVFCFWLCM